MKCVGFLWTIFLPIFLPHSPTIPSVDLHLLANDQISSSNIFQICLLYIYCFIYYHHFFSLQILSYKNDWFKLMCIHVNEIIDLRWNQRQYIYKSFSRRGHYIGIVLKNLIPISSPRLNLASLYLFSYDNRYKMFSIIRILGLHVWN